jgi:hypothetical protein
MKRVFSIALIAALLCTGCAKPVEVKTTDEVTVTPSTAEIKEPVERTRIYGAFTVGYADYIPNEDTNGTIAPAMLVYDYQGYPYTIPCLVNAQYELEKNKIYTFTIKDNIIEKPIEDLKNMHLSTLLWENGGFEVVSYRESNEDEWGIETRGLEFESIDEKTYLEQYSLKQPKFKSIDEYFVDPHEHESCEDGYTKEVDLNNDGKNEKIVVEKLECNGGDGGYFPHIYSSEGNDLAYQDDVYSSPFKTKWEKGAATIYYLDDVLLELTKENVKELYFTEHNNELDFDLSDLEETIMSDIEMVSDPTSGFVVTDDGEVIVKYYIQGQYGHFDCLGYGLLHIKLDKDNSVSITPEFVSDEFFSIEKYEGN